MTLPARFVSSRHHTPSSAVRGLRAARAELEQAERLLTGLLRWRVVVPLVSGVVVAAVLGASAWFGLLFAPGQRIGPVPVGWVVDVLFVVVFVAVVVAILNVAVRSQRDAVLATQVQYAAAVRVAAPFGIDPDSSAPPALWNMGW
ncbi:hypothetical protein [Curtobacterium sp. MCBD17_040]|uniref:hypothetical protein n=1 Tax=Curtobacterium sp. MCBD17_040 TaxID=2175674 RepID=UPI000DA86AF9|nr:hypothetical protein [Curtobacterium sp. MCBD17_040]WIB65836.1 hypothetical protein DEI94_17125 [Curtobacterium sp. MCBD17_040]